MAHAGDGSRLVNYGMTGGLLPVGTLTRDGATAEVSSRDTQLGQLIDSTAVHEVVVVPLHPQSSNPLDVAKWDPLSIRKSATFAVRKFEALPLTGPVSRYFIERAADTPSFDRVLSDNGDAPGWRKFGAAAYVAVKGQTSASLPKKEVLLELLRRTITKHAWHPELSRRQASLATLLETMCGSSLKSRLVAVNKFVDELREVVDSNRRESWPPTLFDVAVEALTASSINHPDPRISERVQELLDIGVEMIEADQSIDVNSLRSFLHVAGFHSRELGSVGDGNSTFWSKLIEALVRRYDGEGHKVLVDFFVRAAIELGDSSHDGPVAYVALSSTFTELALNSKFRELLAMGDVGVSDIVLQGARALAKLVVLPRGGFWMAVLDFCVNATTVPQLFANVIGDAQLWGCSPTTPPSEQCKLNRQRLRALFLGIIKLRAKADALVTTSGATAAEARDAAASCFSVLMSELVSRNVVNLIEDAIAPDPQQAEHLEPAFLRKFMGDERMPFRFLSFSDVEVDLVFTNAIWSAHPILHRLIRDDTPVLPGDATVNLAARLMRLFRDSPANPVLNASALRTALSHLAEIVNYAPYFSTTVLKAIGRHAPAGNLADGSLKPVEDWADGTVIPTLQYVTRVVCSLYPRVGAVDDEFVRGCIDTVMQAMPDGEVATAVSEFTACMLLFRQFTAEGESLGLEVTTLVEGIFGELSAGLCKVDFKETLEPAASKKFVHILRAVESFMRTMRFFSRKNMESIVSQRAPLLRKAVQLLKSASTKHWCPADIRKSSSVLKSWAVSDLCKLSFLEQVDGCIDFNRDALFNAPDGGVGLAAAAVAAAALPGNSGSKQVAAVELALLAHVHRHVAQSLALYCLQEIQGAARATTAADLGDHAGELLASAERNLDRIIYSAQEVVGYFRSHPCNAAALASLRLPPAILDAELSPAKLSEIEAEFFKKFDELLKNAGGVPMTYILPAQLIAVSVATRLVRQDCLLRLATGQGKSIVLALIAMSALRPDGRTPPSRVFMLTTYDHLVKRDHAFAGKLFEAAGIRSIAVTCELSSLKGFADAQIVYANVMSVDKLLADLVMRLYEGTSKLSRDEAAFVNAFFCIDAAPFAVLLDEADLILEDIRLQQPFCRKIPSTMLGPSDVIANREFSNTLAKVQPVAVKEKPNCVVSQTIGNVFFMVHRLESRDGRSQYNLSPCVFRLIQFLARAERVIGVSGSAEEGNVLPGRSAGSPMAYFELPFSHDPSRFNTHISPADFTSETPYHGSSDDLKEASGIWCHARRVVNAGADPAVELAAAEVGEWCQLVVDDVKLATKPAAHGGPRRPVLVFAPSTNVTFRPTPDANPVSVLSVLADQLRVAFSDDVIFTPPKGSITDGDAQRIGNANQITIADLELGRGLDVRPSADIAGGLHVIIATEVAHKRLLTQMIGRTARLGREGSYSIITLRRILAAPPSPSKARSEAVNQWRMAALHQLSALGIAHLSTAQAAPGGGMSAEDRKAWVQRWLMFLYECEERGQAAVRAAEKPAAGAAATAMPEWCIPEADVPVADAGYLALLRRLAPRSSATEPFYASLEALQREGP